MKYKVGDKVRIKSKGWFDDERNKNEATYNSRCIWDERIRYCGRIGTITRASESSNLFKLDLDGGYYDWSKDMFEDSYNPEKSIISEEMIKDIAEVIKKHNLGVSIIENEGKLIIEPLKVEEEEDLPIDTPVMVKCGMWNLGYYAGNKRVFVSGKSYECENQTACGFEIIVPFDKFNPNNIEESLKYNIVK